MAEPWDDENTARLKDIARLYHEETEAYDRLICTARYRGTSMPITPEQRRLVTRNAIARLAKCRHLMRERGVTGDLDAAIRRESERIRLTSGHRSERVDK